MLPAVIVDSTVTDMLIEYGGPSYSKTNSRGLATPRQTAGGCRTIIIVGHMCRHYVYMEGMHSKKCILSMQRCTMQYFEKPKNKAEVELSTGAQQF